MNACNFIGRIGRDAVTRQTQNGNAVTGWALAVDTGWGENKQTVWLDCSAWGDRFEKVAEYIRKGDRLGVQGEIGQREHNGKTYMTLNVHNVTLLGDNKRNRSDGSAGTTGKAPAKTSAKPADTFEDDDIPF